MASLVKRVERLERIAPEPRDIGQLIALVLEGFDDVTAWLLGRSPMPDPHRLAHLLRWPYEEGVALTDVTYFQVMWAVVRLVALHRTAEKTGERIPDDTEARHAWLMANHDRVAGSLMRNADKWLEYADGKRAGTIHIDKPIIGELLVIPYIPGECGPGCRTYSRGGDRT